MDRVDDSGEGHTTLPADAGARRLVLAAAVCVYTAALFAFSVYLRADGFGRLPTGVSSWMTTGSTICAKNWHREGAWNLRFTLYREPASIENAGLRTPYLSFPPGAILPIYILGKARGVEPTPTLTMVYNLCMQFLIACVLGLVCLFVLRRFKVAVLLAAVPPTLYLFLRGSFYEHQMGYFSDQAVMLPFALLLLIETLHMTGIPPKTRAIMAVSEAAVVFWGMFTDWFFGFVLACAFASRLLRGELGASWKQRAQRTLLFWSPALAAVLLFMMQLAYHGGFGVPVERFVYGAGVEQGGNPDTPGLNPRQLEWSRFLLPSLNSRFWGEFLPMAFGPFAKAAILGCAAILIAAGLALLALRVRGRAAPDTIKWPAALALITLAPCLIYYQVFQTHCSIFVHFFTTLKFAVSFALLPLILVGAVLAALSRRSRDTRRRASAVAALLALFAAGGYLAWMGDPRQAGIFDPLRPEYERIGRFVGRHTAYEDVLFSANLDIGLLAPHYLVYAMKPLHTVASLEEVAETLSGVEGPWVLNLLSVGPEAYPPESGLAPLAARAFARYDAGDLHLCKIGQNDFAAAYDTWVCRDQVDRVE
ncbi:MAG TPA: hypothetical protein PKL84_11440 [Candidatus Hydrogenedentes bacterium]|nr:hypothetical protein [Candidatus Hydrogenedentota bacterium]